METLRQIENVERPNKHRRLFLWGVGVLSVLTVVAIFFGRGEAATFDGRDLLTGKVTQEDLVREIRAPGKFVPRYETWVSSRVDARVERRLLEAGAEVTPSSVIMVLSAPELIQSFRRAELEVDVVKARLRAEQAKQRSERREQAAELKLIQIEKDLAIQEAQAQRVLVEKKIVTKFEYQASLLRVKQLETKLAVATEKHHDLPELHRSLLSVIEAEAAQSELQTELLSDQVASLNVTAGVSGTVQSVPWEAGQRILKGVELARVSNSGDLKAQLRVQEAQAKDLALGLKVHIDTRRSKVVGNISRIDPGVINGTVLVDVSFSGALPAEARPELRVDGVVEIERLEDVLTVAKPMMWRPSSSSTLYRIDEDGMARQVVVRYGQASTAKVELLSGLQVGDEVILSDTTVFKDKKVIELFY